MPLLELSAVERVFAGPPEVHALREASFEIERGEYVAITGRSGSGKSTLLNLLGLLDQPTAGSHRFDGLETMQMDDRARTRLRGQRIGYVFQSFNLLPGRTAAENVGLGLLYAAFPKEDRRQIAEDWLGRVGLDHRLAAKPGTLSGGEQQRVAIARAMAKRPMLLLCDEPTGNLDSQSANEVLRILDSLRGAGQTVVVVTHDDAVARRADRILVVADGRVTS